MGDQVWWIITTVAGLAITIISFFLRRTIGETDKHGESIRKIELSYVTQDDFKSYKNQSREDIQQLTADVNELKDKCLSKVDFYRAQAIVNDRLEQIYKLLYEQRGGK